jgi:protein phosphatase 2C family protein 2/3
MDMDRGGQKGPNQRGRIILLGDGSEVLTDSDDTEMFDHSEEDKDLESQVQKSEKTDTTVPEKLPTLPKATDEILPKVAATKEETGADKGPASKAADESK